MQWKERNSDNPTQVAKQYEFERVCPTTGVTLHAVVVYLPADPFRGKAGWEGDLELLV